MSALIRKGSRLSSLLSRNNRRFSSPATTNPAREPIVSSSILADQHPSDPPPPPPAEKNKWGFLKYSLIAALTGGFATAGYATYAYSLSEVDEKTKGIRASAKYNVDDDASSVDKFQAYLRVAALTVSAKLIDVYLDVRRLAEEHIRGFTEPISDKLLPDLDVDPVQKQYVYTLVLDLNETLIYSDWKRERGWRTFKRPGVDDFLEHLGEYYEIVVYSDQLSVYVDPVVGRLERKRPIPRLSRSATRYIEGKHYRDLSKLNRDPAKVIYISGHALESCLQPENCIEIKPWQGEGEDTALLDLIPFLECVVQLKPSDIRDVLASYRGRDVAKEFIERSKEYQRHKEEQKQQGRFWRR